MNTRFLAILFSLLVVGLVPQASAQKPLPPLRPVAVKATVQDTEGKPVEGVTATLLLLSRMGRGMEMKRQQMLTGADGIVELAGETRSEYLVITEKPGYYTFKTELRDVSTDEAYALNGTGVQSFAFVLRAVRRPVPLIQRESIVIPLMVNTKMGFDLGDGALVAPDGLGKVADLYFELIDEAPDSLTGQLKLKVTGASAGDGMLWVAGDMQPMHGSTFQLPYEAPESGYVASHEWLRTKGGGQRTGSDLLRLRSAQSASHRAEGNGQKEANDFESVLLVRVRTQLDAQGAVVRALYGAIEGSADVWGSASTGYQLRLNYWLNPAWERGLEPDAQRSATVVGPPPEAPAQP